MTSNGKNGVVNCSYTLSLAKSQSCLFKNQKPHTMVILCTSRVYLTAQVIPRSLHDHVTCTIIPSPTARYHYHKHTLKHFDVGETVLTHRMQHQTPFQTSLALGCGCTEKLQHSLKACTQPRSNLTTSHPTPVDLTPHIPKRAEPIFPPACPLHHTCILIGPKNNSIRAVRYPLHATRDSHLTRVVPSDLRHVLI